MTANSVEKNIFQQYVEKYYSVVLNVKLVKKKKNGFKTFYQLLELLYTTVSLNTTTNTACFASNFCVF